MKKHIWVISFIALILSACTSFERVVNFKKEEPKTDQIIFHQFIAKIDSDQVVIQELASSFKNGQIKELKPNPDVLYHPLEAIFLTKSGKRIKSVFIEHPLIKEYEYSNQDGVLNRQTSYQDSSIFMVRYNAISDLRSILFTSIEKDTLPVYSKIDISK